MSPDEIRILGYDEESSSAIGMTAGAELAQLVILSLNDKDDGVATALMSIDRDNLIRLLLAAIATLSSPVVISALEANGEVK